MSNSNMNYQEMKQAILRGLVHSGWMAVDEISMNHTSAVAKKSFQTAVGERTAIAYFTDAPEECCKLGGEYTSEGNNVLSTTGFFVWYHQHPRSEVTPEDLFAGAVEFSKKAEVRISDTMPMRLMRQRPAE